MERETALSHRRRKARLAIAIFILGIVLLLPFFIPDPTPPIAFLKKAKLRYLRVNVEPGGRLVTSSYMLEGDPESVVKKARLELKGWSHAKSSSLDTHSFTRGSEVISVVGWNFGSEDKPETNVLYDRPASLVDEIRSPVHKMGSWLP